MVDVQCSTAVLLLASSYVTMTFQVHSFSNSLETVLLVTEILIFVKLVRLKMKTDVDYRYRKRMLEDLEKAVTQQKMISDPMSDLHRMAYGMRNRAKGKESLPDDLQRTNKEYQKALELEQQMLERVKRDSCVTESSSYSLIIALAVVNIFGLFNRPTFVLFVLGPTVWWLYVSRRSEMIYKQLLVFIFTSLITIFIVVFIDSYYFSPFESVNEFISNFDITTVQRLTVTPFNFLQYNLKPKNLAEHGLHPRYLHVLVNMPLLFGPLLIPLSYVLISYLSFLSHWFKNSKALKNNRKHQKTPEEETNIKNENRNKTDADVRKNMSHINAEVNDKLKTDMKILFLVFIFVPVLGLSIFPHQEPRFLIPLLPVVIIAVTLECKYRLHKLFWTCYVLFNLPLGLVFGVFHQGGVVPCLIHIQQTITSKHQLSAEVRNLDIVFSHTYMPPRHLLCVKNDTDTAIQLHDLKGQAFENVCEKIRNLQIARQAFNDVSNHNKLKIYLALPGNLVNDFMLICGKNVSLKIMEKFFPHLSLDDPPNVESFHSLDRFYDMFSLHLYEVMLVPV